MSPALEPLYARLARLEGEAAVRRLMARYLDLCDVPRDSQARQRELAALFTADAIWEGLGVRAEQSFGRHQGRDAVAAFVAGYLPPAEHFALNLHFLGSESIEVGEGADSARGQWLMQQLSTYADGRSELFGSRLNLDFRRLGETWQISHFRTRRLLAMPLGARAEGEA
ncbi:nuclear transport factor 2 family protein [Pseudomonas panipatensis]|uniref:nuclear transport factor 2 family protein n=1 Tax=Pseudomonas panipatensis TaxID=428992 RepID=UPI0035B12E8B